MLTSKPEEFDHDTAKYRIVHSEEGSVCHFLLGELDEHKALIYKKYSNGNELYWGPQGEFHRLFGPAVRRKKMSGTQEEYWINGVSFTHDKYWKEMKKYEKSNKILKDYSSYWNF